MTLFTDQTKMKKKQRTGKNIKHTQQAHLQTAQSDAQTKTC